MNSTINDNMNSSDAIIVFLKYPEEGKVKTRLASKTSDEFAVSFYSIVLMNNLNELDKLSQEVDLYLYCSENEDVNKIKEWIGNHFRLKVQRGNDLGEKMSNAFQEVFSQKYRSVIIIGTDIPDISVEIIRAAIHSLKNYDIVTAPSDDGGYSLLGMRNYYSDLFKDIRWSSATVLSDTKEKVFKNSITYKELDMLIDIDTFEELKTWMYNSKNIKLVEQIKVLAVKEHIKI